MGARVPELSAVGIRLCPTSESPRPTAMFSALAVVDGGDRAQRVVLLIVMPEAEAGDAKEVDVVKHDDFDEEGDTALALAHHPQVASAASTTLAEHLDSNYELDTASKEKRDIAYLFENMIRYVRPSFDNAVTIYDHQVGSA
eukprot:2399887-Rhodomonas_salina.3